LLRICYTVYIVVLVAYEHY